MFQRAVVGLQKYYDLTVIDTQFQKNLGESGRFSIRKVLHFFRLLFCKIGPTSLIKKIDILYYCVSGPSTFGLIKDLVFLSLLRMRASKTVYHLHGAGGITSLTRSNALLRAWARFAIFEPDLVLRPPSSEDEGELCKAKHTIIVGNCVEDPESSACEIPHEEVSTDPCFVFIGLLTEDKGIFDLVEIARLLRDKGHRFTLWIVGEGLPDEVARLRQLISRYDLDKFVRLPGVLIGEQKFALLRRATIFVFPTFFRAETQPTVVMEALSVGLPVVAYDWRGINTMIDQGVNGYLVPVRDIEAFCGSIERILTNENVQDMRSTARRIYLERFTLDRHIDALRRAFRSVSENKKYISSQTIADD